MIDAKMKARTVRKNRGQMRYSKSQKNSIRLIQNLSILLAVIFALWAAPVNAQNVAPIQGLGSIQFLDNNASPLINGVLYSYVAGTTTQQGTFTDATGTALNPNPITFTAGGRAQIWLTIGAFYKFVLCAQNDGASCSPADVLFSVDQVPGGTTSGGGGGGGGSPFTGTFISGTGGPASTGILRLASSDTVCWRNVANSTNLCLSKDTNDILTWAGGSLAFPEITTPSCGGAGLDCIWADNIAHRIKVHANGGAVSQFVVSGVDINTSDQVTQVHFGATAAPFSNTIPSVGQALGWNGSNIVGINALGTNTVYNTTTTEAGASVPVTTMATAPGSPTNYLFTINVSQTVATSGCSLQPSFIVSVIWTDAATGSAATEQVVMSTNGQWNISPVFSSTLGTSSIFAGSYQLRAAPSTIVQYKVFFGAGSGCTTQPTYVAAPDLMQQ